MGMEKKILQTVDYMRLLLCRVDEDLLTLFSYR